MAWLIFIKKNSKKIPFFPSLSHFLGAKFGFFYFFFIFFSLLGQIHAEQARSSSPEAIEKLKKQAYDEISSFERFNDNGVERLKIKLKPFIEYYLPLHSQFQQADTYAQANAYLQNIPDGKFTPNFILSGFNSQTPLTFQTDATAVNTDIQGFSLGLNQLTKIGISYSISYQAQQIENHIFCCNIISTGKFNKPITAPTVYQNVLALGLNIPLFQDFGAAANISSKKANLTYQQSLTQRQQTINNLALNLTGLYWDLKALFQQISALRSRLFVTERIAFEVEERVKAGLLPRISALEQNAQLEQDRSNLVQAEGSLGNLEDTIKRAIGLENFPYGIYPDEDFEPLKLDNSQDIEKQVLEHSLELKNAKLDKEMARYNLVESDNKNRPNVDLNLNYNLYGYGYKKDQAAKLNNDKQINSYTATLSWVIPLGDNGSSSASSANLLFFTQKGITVDDVESKLILKNKNDLRNLKAADGLVQSQRLLFNARKELLEREKEKLRSGVSTTNNFADAQTRLFLAEQSLALAQSNLYKTFYGIEFDRGKIYEYFPRLKNFLNPAP